jgi:hypothetical protein
MHQQPPKTPLLRSSNAANAGQVDSSRALTVYSGTTAERNAISSDVRLVRFPKAGHGLIGEHDAVLDLIRGIVFAAGTEHANMRNA